MNRLVAAGLAISLLQIGLSAMEAALCVCAAARGVPVLDRLPRKNVNDCCTLMRTAVVKRESVGEE